MESDDAMSRFIAWLLVLSRGQVCPEGGIYIISTTVKKQYIRHMWVVARNDIIRQLGEVKP